jgi:hypothetical protein
LRVEGHEKPKTQNAPCDAKDPASTTRPGHDCRLVARLLLDEDGQVASEIDDGAERSVLNRPGIDRLLDRGRAFDHRRLGSRLLVDHRSIAVSPILPSTAFNPLPLAKGRSLPRRPANCRCRGWYLGNGGIEGRCCGRPSTTIALWPGLCGAVAEEVTAQGPTDRGGGGGGVGGAARSDRPPARPPAAGTAAVVPSIGTTNGGPG